jgi:hypothetical protein
MKDALPHMRQWTVEVGGQRAELWLRVPPAGHELPCLDRPNEDRQLQRHTLIVRSMVESFDGAPLSKERARGFVESPTSLAAFWKMRTELYEGERAHGRVHLTCPRCAREGEVDLAVLALALGPGPWPVAQPGGEPAHPSLSELRPPASRPAGASRAARARLELPSARRGLPRPFSEAVLGPPVTRELDHAAWLRWVQGRPFDPERTHWSIFEPGFRAVLRMTLALDALDGERDLSPDIIERLPMTDFLFIDAAYHYLHHLDVTDGESASVVCPGCQERFLLVL